MGNLVRQQLWTILIPAAAIATGLFQFLSPYLRAHEESGSLGATAIIIDSVLNNRFYVLLVLSFQLLVGLCFTGTTRRILWVGASIMIAGIYADWWYKSYQMVEAGENLSYEKIGHFMFLAHGNIIDMIILLSILIGTVLLIKNRKVGGPNGL